MSECNEVECEGPRLEVLKVVWLLELTETQRDDITKHGVSVQDVRETDRSDRVKVYLFILDHDDPEERAQYGGNAEADTAHFRHEVHLKRELNDAVKDELRWENFE